MGSCDVDLKAFAATMSWCPFSNLHSDPFENQGLPKNRYLLMFGSIPHGVEVSWARRR